MKSAVRWSLALAVTLWAAPAVAQVYASGPGCLTCGDGQSYQLVYQTMYEPQQVTAYRVQYDTVCEERKVTTYRPVWETQTYERRYRVARPVQAQGEGDQSDDQQQKGQPQQTTSDVGDHSSFVTAQPVSLRGTVFAPKQSPIRGVGIASLCSQ